MPVALTVDPLSVRLRRRAPGNPSAQLMLQSATAIEAQEQMIQSLLAEIERLCERECVPVVSGARTQAEIVLDLLGIYGADDSKSYPKKRAIVEAALAGFASARPAPYVSIACRPEIAPACNPPARR